MHSSASATIDPASPARRPRSRSACASSGEAEHALFAELVDQRAQVAEQGVAPIEQLIDRLSVEQRAMRVEARRILRIALELALQALPRQAAQRAHERARV